MNRASVSSFYDTWPSFGAALNLWRTWDIIGSYCLQLQRNLEKDIYLFDKLLKGSVLYAWFVRSSQCCYHNSRTSRVAQWQSLLFLKKTICLQRSLILRYHLSSILCKVENLQDNLLSILIVCIIELIFEGTSQGVQILIRNCKFTCSVIVFASSRSNDPPFAVYWKLQKHFLHVDKSPYANTNLYSFPYTTIDLLCISWGRHIAPYAGR
jgi:hypothetical protein